jgi:hypothetical protein
LRATYGKGFLLSGNTMTDVQVRPITSEELPQVKDWIHNSHYIGRWPTGVRYKLGVYVDDKLEGTLLYGPPLRPQSGTELFHNKNGQPIMQNNQVLELLRAFTTDESKKAVPNLGSIVVSRGNELVRSKGETKDGKPIHAILSYADPEQAHRGTVYKATNASYLGPQKGGKVLIVTDPKTGKQHEIHAMTVKQGFKTERLSKLQNHPKLAGKKLEWRQTEGKHKYLFPLGKDQRERDQLMAQLTKPLFSYPEPGKSPKEIPNKAKERIAQLAAKQRPKAEPEVKGKRQVIKNLLRMKIQNPETGNKIMVATALRYDKGHPAKRTAQHIVKKFSEKHGIRVKPSKTLS